jgi:hypothetical protein
MQAETQHEASAQDGVARGSKHEPAEGSPQSVQTVSASVAQFASHAIAQHSGRCAQTDAQHAALLHPSGPDGLPL